MLLLAAALAALAAGGAVIVGSALLNTHSKQADDLLTRVESGGQVRVGVVPTHPQAVAQTGTMGGFDIDVATELGRRIGIGVDLVVLPAGDLLSIDAGWDFAMASSRLTTDETSVELVAPSYYWPISMLVPVGSTATDLASLSGRRICVPAGTIGEAWLAGTNDGANAGPPISPPLGAVAVMAPTDADCLDLVASGSADALVTAMLGPADLVVRPSLRSLVGPVLIEPRGPVVRRSGPDPGRLATALISALDAMRSDGTLLDMSRRRFGADLTSPPSP
jgi:polar amino acid transport system substrate-binding protein